MGTAGWQSPNLAEETPRHKIYNRTYTFTSKWEGLKAKHSKLFSIFKLKGKKKSAVRCDKKAVINTSKSPPFVYGRSRTVSL